MKIEIAWVKNKREPYSLLDTTYFASVQDLAFPFNDFENNYLFVALVKFYFYLGYVSSTILCASST